MPILNPKNPVSNWANQEPSVVESPIKRGLRQAAKFLGIGDPESEIMGSVGGAMEVPNGAALKELARQARAKSQGFIHDLYHGTTKPDIRQFYSPISTTSKYDYGIHATPEPNTAVTTFEGLPPWTSNPVDSLDTGKAVMPLKVRMDKTLEMPDVSRWKNPSSWHTRLTEPGSTRLRAGLQTNNPEFLQELANEAKRPIYRGNTETPLIRWQEKLTESLNDAGYDSIKYPNYMEGQGEPSYLLLDPRKIRSRFAEFDPKKLGSKDIMAGGAPVAAMNQLMKPSNEKKK